MTPNDDMPKIFFGIPSLDRRIDYDCARSIFRMLHFYGGQSAVLMGISDIALARNRIVNSFKKSDCEWLMFVDSDIIFSDDDWKLLWQGDEDIVTASYAKKIPGIIPTDYGLGFTRIHRRVFEKLDSLQHDDGSEMLGRFYFDNEIYVNYFPNGVSGESRWLGEDRAFFMLCALADISHRLEKRTNLQHVGYFLYGYPHQDGGAQFWVPPFEEVQPPDPFTNDA